MKIKSPSGRVYNWEKDTPPTEADMEELYKLDESYEKIPVSKATLDANPSFSQAKVGDKVVLDYSIRRPGLVDMAKGAIGLEKSTEPNEFYRVVGIKTGDNTIKDAKRSISSKEAQKTGDYAGSSGMVGTALENLVFRGSIRKHDTYDPIEDKDLDAWAIGDTSGTNAAIRAATSNLPGAAAGTVATGAALRSPVIQAGLKSPNLGVKAAALLGVAGTGMLAGTTAQQGTEAVTELVAPEFNRQLEKDRQDFPLTTLYAANAAQLPFARPGLKLDLIGRASGAGIGAGLSLGSQLASGGEIDANEIKSNAIIGALLNKNTKLGDDLMIAGGMMHPSARKPGVTVSPELPSPTEIKNPVTSRLGDVSVKTNPSVALEKANSTTEPPASIRRPAVEAPAQAPDVSLPPEPGVVDNRLPLSRLNPDAPVDLRRLALQDLDATTTRKPKPAGPVTPETFPEPNAVELFANTVAREAEDARALEKRAMALVDRLVEEKGLDYRDMVNLRKGKTPTQWIAELEFKLDPTSNPSRLREMAVRQSRREVAAAEARAIADEARASAAREAAEANEVAQALRPTPDSSPAAAKAADEAQATATKAELDARAKAIETQLDAAERLRRSPAGLAALQAYLKAVKNKKKRPDFPEIYAPWLPEKKDAPRLLSGEPAPNPVDTRPALPKPQEPVKSDYQLYQENQARWMEEMKKPGFDPSSDVIQKIWAENERIKNRHGGMPPAPDQTVEAPPARKAPELAGSSMTKEAPKPAPRPDPTGGGLPRNAGAVLRPSAAMEALSTPASPETLAKLKQSHQDAASALKAEEELGGFNEWLERQAAQDPALGSLDELRGAVNAAPYEYRPFLSDLVGRFPMLKSIPGLHSMALGFSAAARVAKKVIGTVEGNIRDVSRPVLGAVIQRSKDKASMISKFTSMTDGLGEIARKSLTKEEFQEFSNAVLSGNRERALAIAFGSKSPKEMLAAIELHQQAMREIAELNRQYGREFNEADFFFHRTLKDRKGLIKQLSGEERSAYDDALTRKRRALGRKLTPDEESDVLNDLISSSRSGGGKPGHLKARTIKTIDDNIAKYYDPFDVSTYDYVARASNDIANQKWFGKTGDDYDKFSGSIGEVFRREIQEGRIKSQAAQDQVTDALKSLFKHSTNFDRDLTAGASRIRRVQTYAYLADISNIIPQFADIFSIAMRYGAGKTASAYGRKKFSLRDISVIDENNHDILRFGTAPESASRTYKAIKQAEKAAAWSMRNLIGRADRINKSALAKAAFDSASEVFRLGKGPEFEALNREYSALYPDKWPAMLEKLKSKDFREGRIDDDTGLFLFTEVSKLQPLDTFGRAQGYNAATPMLKLLYTLRSYAVKQLDIIRERAYEPGKSGDLTRGLANLVMYGALVGIGQQAFSFARDEILGRTPNADPKQLASDYAVNGLLQLMMIPRMSLVKASRDSWVDAGVDLAVPGLNFARDAQKDAMLLSDYLFEHRDAQGWRTTPSLQDAYGKSRMIQYIPAVGRSIYWRTGRGRESIREREQKRIDGKGELPIIPDGSGREGSVIEGLFVRPDGGK